MNSKLALKIMEAMHEFLHVINEKANKIKRTNE